MSFPLACADFTFPLLSHDAALQTIALLEIEGVDVGLFEGRSHLWPSREFVDVVASARRLKQKTEEKGLHVADVFLQMAPDFVPFAVNHPEAKRRRKARDWFLQTCEYSRECGCRHVTTLPGVAFPGEPRRVSLERSCEELAWRVEQARKYDITFGIEAHIGSLAPRPKQAKELVEKVSGLTLTLDLTHFARQGFPDSESEMLLPFASHFHLRGARKGRLQTSFKDNAIDYKSVLKKLRKLNYAGHIGIEYVWIDWEGCNEVDNLSETVLFRDFVRAQSKK